MFSKIRFACKKTKALGILYLCIAKDYADLKGCDMKPKLFFVLTLLTLVAAACGAAAPTAPEPAAPTQAESQPVEIPTLTAAPPTETIPAPTAADTPTEVPAAGGVSFANDVLPILQASCNECHGGKQTKAGLDLKTYGSLMAGSLDGPVVVAGSSADSLLVQMVEKGKMPKRGPKLTPEQVQIISDWIAAGALDN
jgi:mono/diheme cytochrome c family protein